MLIKFIIIYRWKTKWEEIQWSQVAIKPVRYLISIYKRSPIKTDPPLPINRCWLTLYKLRIKSPGLLIRLIANGVITARLEEHSLVESKAFTDLLTFSLEFVLQVEDTLLIDCYTNHYRLDRNICPYDHHNFHPNKYHYVECTMRIHRQSMYWWLWLDRFSFHQMITQWRWVFYKPQWVLLIAIYCSLQTHRNAFPPIRLQLELDVAHVPGIQKSPRLCWDWSVAKRDMTLMSIS